eukprot:3245635-Amphidinium_carterae.1
MQKYFQRLVKQHRCGCLELTKERGIYNLYVQVPTPHVQPQGSVPLCPNEMEMDVEGATSSGSGGHRQAYL